MKLRTDVFRIFLSATIKIVQIFLTFLIFFVTFFSFFSGFLALYTKIFCLKLINSVMVHKKLSEMCGQDIFNSVRFVNFMIFYLKIPKKSENLMKKFTKKLEFLENCERRMLKYPMPETSVRFYIFFLYI
jgi:hypothetical protein